MENKANGTPKLQNKPKTPFDYFYKALLSLSVGWTWAFIALKACRFYFQDWSWYNGFVPGIIYLIASLTYIIIGFAFYKFTKPAVLKYTEEEIRYQKRLGHLHAKPTIIKDQLKNFIFFAIALAIAILIIL